ncbi:porin [Shinella sp. S4-D37]|uniref:porin n=1 Tax=Shinella sp. S4-D37 TaxID=3161999 RepID=UPI00346716FE
MNIKSLLIGSAAALAAVSGAQAADAIVAAEPEPMEYVRVCDAFGTGYFYIPGTETCLQIGGYVRFQVDFKENAVGNDAGYKAFSRGFLTFDAKSDTELGTLTGHIDLITNSNGATGLDSAFIQVSGFTVGYFYNYWDTGINGETDSLDGGFLGFVGGGDIGNTLLNAISYKYDGGAFSAGASLESFANNAWAELDNGLGISGIVTGSFGAVSIDLIGSYDFLAEQGALRGRLSADVGPGTLQGAVVWSSGASRYWDASEWAVAASYKANLSDKLAITPGFQYWGTIDHNGLGTDYVGDRDAWRAGVTLDYTIVTDLTAKVSLQYTDVDGPRGAIKGGQDDWSGFVRLERSF